MPFTPSSSGTTGLCNPLVDYVAVNTFPLIGPRYESGDVINNRMVLFVGSVQIAYKRSECRSKFISGQLRVSRKLEE
jgi:hypothetical protein